MSTNSDEAKPSLSDQKPTKIRWLIFALACMTSFVLYLHRYTWGFIKRDVQEEFDWSEWELGFLDSIFNATYAFGQIPSGILCDWFGPQVLLGSIILLWTVSMGSVALATGFVSALVYRAAFGLTQAGCYPTLSKISKLWFPLSVRTSVQGWIATFFGRGGGAASFILVGTVLMGYFKLTWREALYVLTGVGVLFGLMFLWLFRNRPQDHPWSNEAEAELIAEGKPSEVEATGTALRWSRLLKSPNMMVFFVQQFTSAFADNVYVYWIPLYLLTAKNVDTASAGWMAALPLIGGAVGGMIGGVLQNHLIIKTGNRRWVRSLIGMIGKLLATILMFVSLGFDAAVAIVVIFAFVKFFGDWSQPTVWGTITDVAGKNAATVFGAVNTVGSIAGFLAGPLMGLMIMSYSEITPVENQTVAETQIAVDDPTLDPTKVKYEFGKKNLVKGTLKGSLKIGDQALATFVDPEDADFSFVPAENSLVVAATLDKRRGILTVQWKGKPRSNSRVVVHYHFTDYSNGWTALFLALGVIYLVSSLSWLFIDCTKTIEDE